MTPADAEAFRGEFAPRIHDKLGAHPATVDGRAGIAFTLWAPNARRVAVVGSFNDWSPEVHPLESLGDSGLWATFVPGVERGAYYKFKVESRFHDYVADKADPFAIASELPPGTASRVWDLKYDWRDAEWLASRAGFDPATAPMAIYELHLGSWKRQEPERMPSYRELACELVPYLVETGFTHVELLPPMEHPYYASWGYQTTGYFAPSSRYGTPQDLMYLIEQLHLAGIGVVLDWVPSHFPHDEHGLAFFDGTYLFEHADPRQGYHPDWNSFIFNLGRNEVRSFLVASALHWIEHYHVDAIRVDAVASMLYLDYSRQPDEWIPNRHGGRENLESISFLRLLNKTVHESFPGVKMIAEESTAWPMVSRPDYLGGLGFDMKWDMGWMHDTLEYAALDPIHRKYHHDQLSFRMLYAFTENFVLALSHDEVVHGKSSLLGKMPGDSWQKFANLRALYGYMYGQPGKKLLFMGSEIAPWNEWHHDTELDWSLLRYTSHAGVRAWVSDLNRLYRESPALHERDFDPEGFRWVDCHDADQSVLSFTRHGKADDAVILVVCNFTPVPRRHYRVGVPRGGRWRELLNSDAESYGGSGVGNLGGLDAMPIAHHGHENSLTLTLPPLGVLFLTPDAPEAAVPGAATSSGD